MVCFTLCFSPPSCRDPILQGRGLSCQFPAKEFPARWKDQPGIHVVFFSWQSLQLSAASHPLWKRQEWMKMRKLTKYEQLLTKFFLTWMIDIYICIHPEDVLICNPVSYLPPQGLLLQLGVSLDDLFNPIFSHLAPRGPLPTRNKGDTIRRMMRHLRWPRWPAEKKSPAFQWGETQKICKWWESKEIPPMPPHPKK